MVKFFGFLFHLSHFIIEFVILDKNPAFDEVNACNLVLNAISFQLISVDIDKKMDQKWYQFETF